MHDFLLALKDLAAPAVVQVVQGIALMTWAFACYALLLLYVMPRVQTVDVSGWVFAGPLTLSVACLIVCASLGIGQAAQVLIAAGLSIAAILTSVVGLLLGHRSSKAWAERPAAPIVPTTTTTTTTAPAEPVPPATAAVTTTTETGATP